MLDMNVFGAITRMSLQPRVCNAATSERATRECLISPIIFIAKDVCPKVAIINAGDGRHAHPTQAMLDMLTIRRETNAATSERATRECLISPIIATLKSSNGFLVSRRIVTLKQWQRISLLFAIHLLVLHISLLKMYVQRSRLLMQGMALQPRVCNAATSERATRECLISPIIATLKSSNGFCSSDASDA
jgi:hypothetical protein